MNINEHQELELELFKKSTDNLKENKSLFFLQKIKNLHIKINNNNIINIYSTDNTKLWYSEIIKLIYSIFTSNYNCVVNIDDSDIIIANKHDTNLNLIDKIVLVINGEKEDINFPCDIGILTTNIFIHPYNIYFPHMFASFWERRTNYKIIKNTKKTEFCAYMYSWDLKYRVELYEFISSYKKVNVLGKSCNLINNKCDRFVYNDTITYNDIAVEKYSKYKFVLALENGPVNGYFTEKIINPILAGSIPIYTGTSDVFKYINKNRVIYVYDYNTYDDLLKSILIKNYIIKLFPKKYLSEILILIISEII